MAIQAQQGQDFYAIIEGLASGLVGSLQCGIIRQDGTVVSAEDTAAIIEIDAPSGNYQATRSATEAGTLLVQWIVPPNGDKYIEELDVGPTGQPQTFFIGYPPAATIITGSRVDELLSLTPDELDTLRAQSIAAIEEYTQQSFVPLLATLHVDGSGGTELYLPQRLERLDSISAKGAWWPGGYFAPDEYANIDLDTVELSDDRFRLTVSQVIPNYAVQAMDWGDQPYKRVFPPGPDSIAISGEWGWPAVPTPVIQAIRADMEDTALADANQLSSTIRSYRKLGLTAVRQGNLSGQLAEAPALSMAAQRLLRPYVHPGQMGALA